jgi:hypothetical protein
VGRGEDHPPRILPSIDPLKTELFGCFQGEEETAGLAGEGAKAIALVEGPRTLVLGPWTMMA